MRDCGNKTAAEVVAKVESEVESCKVLKLSIEEQISEYDSWTALQHRLDLLVAALDPNAEVLAREKSRWVNEQGIAIQDVRPPIPVDKLILIKQTSVVQNHAKTLGKDAKSQRDFEKLQKDFANEYSEPLAFLARACNRLQQVCLTQRKRSETNLLKAEAAKAKAVAKQLALSISPATKIKRENISVYSAATSGLEEFREIQPRDTPPNSDKDSDQDDGAGLMEEPWVLRKWAKAQQCLNTNPTRLNLLVFRASFAKSGLQSDQKPMAKAESLRTTMLTAGADTSILLMEENPRITSTLVFGYSQHYRKFGTGLHSAGLLRLFGGGAEMLVFACPFLDLLEAVRNQNQSSEYPKIPEIAKFMRESTGEVIEKFIQENKLDMKWLIVKENDLVYIPAGWYIMERVINGPLLAGVQVSLLPRSSQGGTSNNLVALQQQTVGMQLVGAAAEAVTLLNNMIHSQTTAQHAMMSANALSEQARQRSAAEAAAQAPVEPEVVEEQEPAPAHGLIAQLHNVTSSTGEPLTQVSQNPVTPVSIALESADGATATAPAPDGPDVMTGAAVANSGAGAAGEEREAPEALPEEAQAAGSGAAPETVLQTQDNGGTSATAASKQEQAQDSLNPSSAGASAASAESAGAGTSAASAKSAGAGMSAANGKPEAASQTPAAKKAVAAAKAKLDAKSQGKGPSGKGKGKSGKQGKPGTLPEH